MILVRRAGSDRRQKASDPLLLKLELSVRSIEAFKTITKSALTLNPESEADQRPVQNLR